MRLRGHIEFSKPALVPAARSRTISLAYATRRANSIQAAKEILLNAEPRFPKEPAIKYNLACYFCQTGHIQKAKNYLKKAFEIDLNWRRAALEDEDLKPLWDSL
jgi:Tfp pilus assembly protein PilF